MRGEGREEKDWEKVKEGNGGGKGKKGKGRRVER